MQEAELAQQKQELASVIEASQTAYDARDEVQRQIEALRETIATEVQEFEVEWRQKMKVPQASRRRAPPHRLTATCQDLEEDAKAKRSQREREAAVQARAVAKGKDLRHQSAKVRLGPDHQDHRLHLALTQFSAPPPPPSPHALALGPAPRPRSPRKTLWDIARREVDLKRQKEKVKSYEEAFERMKKETGPTSFHTPPVAWLGLTQQCAPLHRDRERGGDGAGVRGVRRAQLLDGDHDQRAAEGGGGA